MDNKPISALTVALDAISDRWSLTIVRELAFGPRRFTDLARSTGAPRDVLVARLRTMEGQEMVERQPYGSGKREMYALTEKGVGLAEVILVLKKWGDRYKPSETVTVELVHERCGSVFEAKVHCASCGMALEVNELHPTDSL
jgi:DNA-binding HxlR family transcriptional regulator